jgi:hypothetical protein
MGNDRQESSRALPAALLAAVLATLLLLAGAPAASANVGETIIYRCTHGQSLAGFSQSAYAQALSQLSADAEEYSPCSSEIRQAQLAGAGQKTGGSGGGSSGAGAPALVAATPVEQQAIQHAAHVQPAPLQVEGATIRPGVVHSNVSSAVSSLPAPLLATVILALLALLVLAALRIRDRVRAGRPD